MELFLLIGTAYALIFIMQYLIYKTEVGAISKPYTPAEQRRINKVRRIFGFASGSLIVLFLISISQEPITEHLETIFSVLFIEIFLHVLAFVLYTNKKSRVSIRNSLGGNMGPMTLGYVFVLPSVVLYMA